MKIIAVDDEPLALRNLVSTIKKVSPKDDLCSFDNSEDAFEYVANNPVDVAFLDIEMGGYSGLELAKKYRELNSKINIIFVTAYSNYSLDALKIHVSGYLLKPVGEEELREEIENLRFPISDWKEKRVRIQTFGNFEVFVDETPLRFTRSKAKELLAYLVDRYGARVTSREVAAVLWEDQPYDQNCQNRTRQIVYSLMKSLDEYDIRSVVFNQNHELAICPDQVDCDLYRYMAGDEAISKFFRGDYMSNYSWAEDTLGLLTDKMSRNHN